LAAKGPFRLLPFAQFLPITQSVHGATGCDSPQSNGAGDPPLISVEAFGGAIDVPKFLEAAMHSKTFFWSVGACVLVLALGTSVVAQDRSPEHFRGIINDITAAHDAKGKPSGPWELHGAWRLDLSRDGGTADFSAALTMENSDYWLLINSNPPADPDSPATRNPHTHHINLKDAQVTWDPNLVSSGCPSASYTPATTTGFMVTGSALITGNGGYPPFAPHGQLSPLTVCVTGGTLARFSNVTLVFGKPASGHFGSQAINGAVRVRE
jgi:hypothetical protein